MKPEKDVRTILFYRIGQLGDTIVSIPAIQFFREQFPNATFTLMSDRIAGKKYVLARQVFENTSLFDKFISYRKSKEGRFGLKQKIFMLLLLPRLLFRYDAVVYLAPSSRTPKQVRRDRFFFKCIGAKYLWGFQREQRPESADHPLMHEADWLLAQFKNYDFETPQSAVAKMELLLDEKEHAFAESWLRDNLGERNGRLIVGFGPGTKMPAKRWKVENFWNVGHKLIKQYDIFPIVFGDQSDRLVGDALVRSWKRGCNTAGELSVRQSSALLKKCDVYIGNDTGTMHLAAAVKTPCVAIFSARDVRGKWEPLGDGHVVLRKDVKCRHCMATTCDDKICLMLIRPEEVAAEAERIIQRSLQEKHDQPH